MTKKKSATKIISILLLIILIGYGLWAGKHYIEQRAFESGAASIITEIVGRTIDPACQPINLFVGEQKVDLINVTCIDSETLPTQEQAEEAAATP